MAWRLQHSKRSGQKLSWPKLCSYPGIRLEALGIARVSADIATERLPSVTDTSARSARP
jgi:hypothetical protein